MSRFKNIKAVKEKNLLQLHRALRKHVDTDELVKTMYQCAIGVWVEKTDKDGTIRVYQEKPDKDSAKLLFEQKFGKPAQQIDLNENRNVFHNFKPEDLKRMQTPQLLKLLNDEKKKSASAGN